MNWITRERPKIDRIACPWLIKNFIDAQAQFFYVPFDTNHWCSHEEFLSRMVRLS
jgi:hypothetical protein